MNVTFKQHLCFAVGVVCICALGCGRKDSYTQVDVGPHGLIRQSKTVKYTPEQQTEIDTARGYVAQDPDLATIQRSWLKLTVEQRATVLNTVKQMAGE